MIRFEPAPKASGSFDRTAPVEETEELLSVLLRRFGITRVGDTTRLDRTGVPTFCAMVPRSPDILGVYNGKGRTRAAARVSAIMEAIERQAAASLELPTFVQSLADLRELNLEEFGMLALRADEQFECVEGVDLLTGRATPVPSALVAFPWRGPRVFERTSTNGLASGNSTAEAVYHALTEMVERHVWSLFHVRAEVVPRFYGGASAGDRAVAPSLTFPTGNTLLDNLYDEIVRSGLKSRVMILREGTLPTVALATIVEPNSEPPMAHLGAGCSLSPVHAVERALCEAVQSRIVDIQGAREDFLRADDPQRTTNIHTRRPKVLPKGSWFVDLDAPSIVLSDLIDESSDDLAEDIHQILGRLPHHGVERLACVDLSPSQQPFTVVRLISSDFETTAVDGHMGRHARAEFNPFKSLNRITKGVFADA